jgi:hypothetical protein
MSAAISLPRVSLAPVSIGLIAVAIACVGPFDSAVGAVTMGHVAPRVAIILAMITVGIFSAGQTGLCLKGPIAIGFVFGAVVAGYVCLTDGLLFRHGLPANYVGYFHTLPLGERMTYYFMRAFQENIVYRLFLFSVVIYALTRLRNGPVSLGWAVAAMIGVQVLNVWINVAPMTGYDVIRYVVPGSLWAWLYWRFGFVTAEVGHVSCHAFLQPILGVLI